MDMGLGGFFLHILNVWYDAYTMRIRHIYDAIRQPEHGVE
jgi:hypothetical protein